jgi:protein arginine phosphatase
MVRVLFVCTGNTCRSPMAEAILRRMCKDLRESGQLPDGLEMEVRSAGVYAANGMQASAHAQTVLTENGIEHNHSSSLLSEQDVTWATHILTMTTSHREAILYSFPQAAGKTFTLKEFVGETGHPDVQDPYGGNKEIYSQTYKELEGMLEKLIGKFR